MYRYDPRSRNNLSRRLLLALAALSVLMMWTCALLPAAASGPWTDGDVGPASPGPDLNATSTDIVLSDTTPRDGETVTITFTARNTGDQAAINVTVEFYHGDRITGNRLYQDIIPSIGGGSSVTKNVQWSATEGDQDLTMYLDPDDSITEDSESNNVAVLTVTVEGLPDVRLEQGAFLLSSNGEGTITITADAFNGGNATATGYDLGIYNGDPGSGGTLIGRTALPDIPAGGRVTITQSWSAPPGGHHLYAQLEGTDSADPSGNDQIDRDIWITSDLTARAGPDHAAFPGQSIIFNGSGSSSDSSTIVNYTWDMGDGNTLYGAVVSKNYTNTGSTVRTLTVRLTIRDASGGTDSDTATVYINPQGSSPPTADAGTAPSGMTGEDLSFNASGSLGNIISYTWDFGDGTGASGIGPTHSYGDDGTYTVTLAVVSNVSLADVDVIQVTVTNRAPVVEAIDDISTDVGVSLDLVVLANDDDGYIASYSWDFGDATTSSVRDPSHTWTTDGPHQASVNVTDDDGSYTIVTFWVNVTDVAPIAFFTADPLRNEGQTVRVDASGTVEPGGIISWEWDWESDDVVDNTTGPQSQFAYGSPGYYNITLRVTDGEGSTNETVMEVLILNVAPTARGTVSPRSSLEGTNWTFDASTSTEPGDNIIRYYWDWDGDDEYDFNTTEPVVNHTYLTVGRFYARLMVEDEDGSFDDYTSTWWLRVDVGNAVPLVNASVSQGTEGVNITVTVDAYEPGNNLVGFGWDFDGDYVADAHTEVPYVNHTWWEAGIFWVWVNVTDEDHMNPSPSWGGGEIMVNVSDVAPKPRVEGGQATEGEPAEFTVVMKGTETNISTFHFDLDGDGTYDVTSTTWTTLLTFTQTGEVECIVKVVDTDGSEGIAPFNVYVFDVAPTVTGPSFLLAAEGEPLSVSVIPQEPGMDIARYEFDWNADGIVDDTATEPRSFHSYTKPGAKLIIVTVIDVDGSSGSMSIPVLVANSPPTADAGTPPQVYEGEPVELNASLSTEPGGHIVAYEWDYDEDGLFDYSTREASHMHVFDTPGVHTIILRVMDADGTFDEDITTVAVLNAEPIAAIQVQVMPEDMPSMLDASRSRDPGGIILYQWNISAVGQRLDKATTEPYLQFTFDRRIRYDITLTVTDGEGSYAEAKYVVDVDDVITLSPTVTWETPNLVMEGGQFQMRAWAEDPFPDDPALKAIRMMDFTWDMGDGSPVKRGASVSHAYLRSAAEPIEVWLTVIDEDNDRVVLMVANITVLNPAPLISPVPPITVKAGKTGDTTVQASDVTTPDGELVFTLDPSSPEWLSLDGNTLMAEPGKDVVGGTYVVTITVTDILGASSYTQVPVVVTTSGTETSGIGWGTFLVVLIVCMLIVLVVAVLISTRMRPGAGAQEKPSAKGKDYDDLYGEEPRRRKVRPVAKVEKEKVDVDYSEDGSIKELESEVPDYALEASASAAAYASAYEPPAMPVEEPEEEPPLPSWMTPKETVDAPDPAAEVHLEEKAVEPPPAIPPDWQASPEPAPDQPYRFRKGTPEKKVQYKGTGKPRR